MKKLICVKDVEVIIKQGHKIFYIEENTIITPAAKDTAKIHGIEFSLEKNNCNTPSCESSKANTCEVDSNMFYAVLKALADNGLLQDLLDKLPGLPYFAECESGGFKVVRGNSVKLDVFDTGNPNNKVFYQELISGKDKSPVNAGFLTIEKSRFECDMTYEEIDYVIEGTLTVEINGRSYTARPGDVIYVPIGSKVVWGSPDKAKVFYTTYSAN